MSFFSPKAFQVSCRKLWKKVLPQAQSSKKRWAQSNSDGAPVVKHLLSHLCPFAWSSTMTLQKWRSADEGNEPVHNCSTLALCKDCSKISKGPETLSQWEMVTEGQSSVQGFSAPLYLMLPVSIVWGGGTTKNKSSIPHWRNWVFSWATTSTGKARSANKELAAVGCTQVSRQARRSDHCMDTGLLSCLNSLNILGDRAKAEVKVIEWALVKDSKPSPRQMSNKPCSSPSVQKNFKRLRGISRTWKFAWCFHHLQSPKK